MQKKSRNHWKILYYVENDQSPVITYIEMQSPKTQQKISEYILLLRNKNTSLRPPFVKKIVDKIWELRIEYHAKHHRIFYFFHVDRTIVLLHAFTKKTNKAPRKEIQQAFKNYKRLMSNL